MEGEDLAVLGRRLEAARSPGADGETRCGLCESRLDEESAVEVALASSDDGPDAWLCGGCYGHVVEEMNVAPLRVFKAGSRRSVVLPVSADSGPQCEAGN